MNSLVFNNELNGIELYFDKKPVQTILNNLKENGFRWSSFKSCWYAKQSEKTIATAQQYIEEQNEQTKNNIVNFPKNDITAPQTKTKKEKKTNITLSLWDRLQFVEGNTKKENYKYKFVGSNYTNLSVKDTAKEIRNHLKIRFPEIKFSVTSDRNHIYVYIVSSPYIYSKLEYSPELSCSDYRNHEKEHNKELNAILNYCTKLVNSYNFDDSDSMSDYFHCHYYDTVKIDYKYTQTEQSEQIKEDIKNFRNKLIEEFDKEQERKEKEYQEYLKQREIENQEAKKASEERKRQVAEINSNINITELEEKNQYFVIGSQFARLNKNDTLKQYIEEVNKGDFTLENVKITKELYLNNEEIYNYFCNNLLTDFDFLQGTGGSFTDDKRINAMIDFENMDEYESSTVQWNLYGVAVYLNNELKLVVDAQGGSYARYVGLVENTTIEKEYNTKQLINNEDVEALKNKANILVDYSVETIDELNILKTWNGEHWKQYKEHLKEKLKVNNFIPTKAIIQQIDGDLIPLKFAMYKLLTEVDSIQEQFSKADLKQGQKLTIFKINDFGMMSHSQITVDQVENSTYAQYTDVVKLAFKQPNKKGLYYRHLYNDALIYSGWLDLPKTVLHDINTSSSGFIVTSTKYSSCDKKQYDAIIEHFKQQNIKSIINTYKPIF